MLLEFTLFAVLGLVLSKFLEISATQSFAYKLLYNWMTASLHCVTLANMGSIFRARLFSLIFEVFGGVSKARPPRCPHMYRDGACC